SRCGHSTAPDGRKFSASYCRLGGLCCSGSLRGSVTHSARSGGRYFARGSMTMIEGITSGQSIGYRRTAVTVTGSDLLSHAGTLLDAGFRVALIAGHDDGDKLRAVYLFVAGNPDRRIEVHVPLERERPAVPSLAELSFPAGRFEREMRDLYGIV